MAEREMESDAAFDYFLTLPSESYETDSGSDIEFTLDSENEASSDDNSVNFSDISDNESDKLSLCMIFRTVYWNYMLSKAKKS